MGLGLLLVLVGIAVFGPLVAPHSITEIVGPPGTRSQGNALLGTDVLGRDVLSRVLHGGWSAILLGAAATLLSYAAGMTIGLAAGYSRTVWDPLLMRGVDVLLSLPALLVLLLLATGVGTSVPVLLLGVVLVQLPGISRVIRSATMEVTTRAYVEAAVARGERPVRVISRDVLPNIAHVLLADVGIRFGYSIILIASMNYLNLGLKPPAADWGLMTSENRDIIGLNAWAVLAPGILLALLTISVNLVADAYARSIGRSTRFARRGGDRGAGRAPEVGPGIAPVGAAGPTAPTSGAG